MKRRQSEQGLDVVNITLNESPSTYNSNTIDGWSINHATIIYCEPPTTVSSSIAFQSHRPSRFRTRVRTILGTLTEVRSVVDDTSDFRYVYRGENRRRRYVNLGNTDGSVPRSSSTNDNYTI